MHKLFQIFNNNSEVDPESYKQLINHCCVRYSPDLFFVGYTHNPSKNHNPSLPVDSKCNMEVNHCTYRISGIVYVKSRHYFCEVYSTRRNCKSGWYVYKGLWNNGKGTFVGSRPLFLEKESLYLLMIEKIKSNNHANNDGVSTTFYRPIHCNNNEIMKDIINKVLLSSPDNKVKLVTSKQFSIMITSLHEQILNWQT